MTFSQWHQSGQYFNYKEQYPVFFQEAGQGEPILFLHGFPTASWDWHKIWEPLAQNYHLIAFDFKTSNIKLYSLLYSALSINSIISSGFLDFKIF